MEHRIENNKLIITCTPAEQAELREIEEEMGQFCDDDLYEFFDGLIGNSDLEWIDPAVTGDLTSAPMLGICGSEGTETEINMEQTSHLGLIFVGQWDNKEIWRPILSRWAFMDYQLRSPLEDLMEKGEVVFAS